MKTTLFLPSLLFLATTTLAHFTLDYPYTRGFDEDAEATGPCGSFNTPNTTRTPWYYLDGPVEIDSHHDTATVQIFLGASNASTLLDFHSNNLTDVLPIAGQGEFCFKVNASSPTRSSNTSAVLMVEHISVHGHLYQCSDVTFSSNASLGRDITCTDSLTARLSSSSDEDDDGKAATSASDAASGPFKSLTLYAAVGMCLIAGASMTLM
ncbi:hypothetical protein CBS101457_005713 [Exobasidium rhododendri]|nr:hypothetical protein CBS101457_005713 [Exobasidium rhododendri]